MDPNKIKQISKATSYVLRHKPESVGIELRDGGWVAIDTLIEAMVRSGNAISRPLLEQVVETSDKQRFEISEDGQDIRARQGHSVRVDLEYSPVTPPDILYHGTATRFLDSILQQGLVKGKRHHVHLSTDKKTMLDVGMRHGKPVLLEIHAARMHADGYEFFVTGNNVWLTDHVPAVYLRQTQ